MALNLKKRDLTKYDLEVHTDISGSMQRPHCPGGQTTRYVYAKGWVMTFVQEAEAFDDDGPTVGFFDDRLEVFENTTFDSVKGRFGEFGPRGSTDTAQLIRERCADYLDARLGKPGVPGVPGKPAVKGGFFSRGTPAVAEIPAIPPTPPNPKVKPRIILVITDGIPNDEALLEREIIAVTKRMSAGGLTKDDLVITFVQVGDEPDAKGFLERLNNGLESKGATMDIVGCITCDEVKNMTTKQLLEAALDAE